MLDLHMSEIHLNVKHFGVKLDTHLTLKSHINNLCSNIYPNLVAYFLKQGKCRQKYTYIMLYYALIKPYFTYCITIWGNYVNTYWNKLEILQKKILIIMTFSD